MTSCAQDTALIISSRASELHASSIWGTGGWLPPREREVLDWITLINWMGWKIKLIDPDELTNEILDSSQVKWIILTDNPDDLDPNFTERLFEIPETYPVLIVSQAGAAGSPFSNRFGICVIPGTIAVNTFDWKEDAGNKSWNCRKEISIHTLKCNEGIDPLVTANENILVAVKKRTLGKWAVLSFHPGKARDIEGSFTSLLKHILVYQSCLPVAWFNFENTLVLRMDDPGSSEMVHNSIYQHTKLTEADWKVIGDELQKKKARMTLGYVPGWVDDGDDTRGNLAVNGKDTVRKTGSVYPSPQVRYESLEIEGKKKLFDYESEFQGIQQLRNKGLVEAELHGYTHIHPDKKSWINAADKYDNKAWYREFGRNTIDYIKNIPDEEHPFELGLNAFRDIFQSFPSTLICPGDEFTNNVLLKTMDAGLKFVSSYYLAVRIENRLCWDQYVCAPYLDRYDPSWLDAGLPVVGYFHDFDISINGADWLTNCLESWQKAGVKYFIDFRELAGVISHTVSLINEGKGFQLKVQQKDQWNTIHPVRISAYFPETRSDLHFECDLSQSIFDINLSKESMSLARPNL